MRRWPKVLLAVLAALVVLLILNAVALDRQTKDAGVTVEGGEILRLPGGDLQVLDEGPREAPAIVLLHCYTCAIDWWERVIPLLEGEHRVVAIDLLGHGGSEKPRSGYSIVDQAERVAQALGELGVSRATIVGHSLGGAVAAALNERSPELVGGVVVVDTAPGPGYGNLGLIASATQMPLIGEALWRTKMDWSIRDGLKEAFAPGFDVLDGFVEDVKRMTYPAYDGSSSGFDDYIEAEPLDERLRENHPPLMVIFGREEQIVDDPREALSAYADIPNARTALIEGAGHSPNVEKPAETARLILQFVQESAESSVIHRRASGDRQTIATCHQSTPTPPAPGWRDLSVTEGPLSLVQATDFNWITRTPQGFLLAKIPAVVEGHKEIALRVPRSQRRAVGLLYGEVGNPESIQEAAAQVSFMPCSDRSRTVWPGGLALADRNPITLEVVTGGSVKKIRVG